MNRHADPTPDTELSEDSDASSLEVRSAMIHARSLDTHSPHSRQDPDSHLNRLRRNLEEVRIAFLTSVEESQVARHAALWQEQEELLKMREHVLAARCQELKATFHKQKEDLMEAQARFYDNKETLRQDQARMPLLRTLCLS
jgi:hypothetical protein